MKSRTALLAGASGLVGGHCLRCLLDDANYDRVLALVRAKLDIIHEKLVQHVVDFDHLDRFAHLMIADDVYCCLGTTIKKAGSQEAFRMVDYGYPAEIARIAAENGSEQFLIVTSIGADRSSPVFYSRVKGETEEAVKKYAFRAIHIFRPSLLLGDRKEFRPAEHIGALLMRPLWFIFVGKFRKYRAVHSETVAQAMVCAARQGLAGVRVYESDVLGSLGFTHGH